MEDALDSVIMSALNKGIEVICVLDPRMPPAVRGDGDRLKQVVLNLLSVGPATNRSTCPSTHCTKATHFLRSVLEFNAIL